MKRNRLVLYCDAFLGNSSSLSFTGRLLTLDIHVKQSNKE